MLLNLEDEVSVHLTEHWDSLSLSRPDIPDDSLNKFFADIFAPCGEQSEVVTLS